MNQKGLSYNGKFGIFLDFSYITRIGLPQYVHINQNGLGNIGNLWNIFTEY